jgi:hypothetical protein
MKFEQAKEILHALFLGTDPTTDQPLPDVPVLQRAETLRAFQTAIRSLEESIKKEAFKAARPTNASAPWSEEEKQRLVAAFQSGTSIDDLAVAHGRTVRAIESRLVVLGLIEAEARAHRPRYVEEYGDPKK